MCASLKTNLERTPRHGWIKQNTFGTTLEWLLLKVEKLSNCMKNFNRYCLSHKISKVVSGFALSCSLNYPEKILFYLTLISHRM